MPAQYNMKPVRLIDIADIRVGHTFRGTVPKDPAGPMAFVTISDIREEGTVSSRALERIKDPTVNEELILRHNDILLPGRGGHYRAARYEEEEGFSYPIVPSNLLFIIRAKPQVLPRYLCWMLQQDQMVEHLKGLTFGSNIPFLPKRNLEEVGIDLPPLKTQEQIVALIGQHEKRQLLLERLRQNNEALTQGMVRQLIKGTSRYH